MSKKKRTSIIGITITIVILIVIVMVSNIKIEDVTFVESTLRKNSYACTKWINIFKKLDVWQ